MTPKQFRKARKDLGLGVTALARLFGVTRQAITLWETGKRPIPQMAVWLFAYFKEFGTPETAFSGD